MFRFAYEDIVFLHDDTIPEQLNLSCHKLIFCISGSLNCLVENQTTKLIAGNILFVPKHSTFEMYTDKSESFEYYLLAFPDTYIPPLLQKDSFFNRETLFADCKQFSWIFAQLDMYQMNFAPDKAKVLCICDLIKIIIFLSEMQRSTIKKANLLISAIISYIHDHLYEPISLESLSKEFSFSKSYICTEFKKEFNVPIMHYIRSKKIILAHQLILNGEKCTDVAERLGFENYSTFYRSYMSVMGYPPIGEKSKKTD